MSALWYAAAATQEFGVADGAFGGKAVFGSETDVLGSGIEEQAQQP